MSLEIVYLINIGVGLLIVGLAIPLILKKIKLNMGMALKPRRPYPMKKSGIRLINMPVKL